MDDEQSKTEKARMLYEYSRNIFNEEFDRGYRLEEKADRSVAILAILFGVFGFNIGAIIEAGPVCGTTKAVVLTISILVTFLLVVCLIISINVAGGIKRYKREGLDNQLVQFFQGNNVDFIFNSLSSRLVGALEDNTKVIETNAKALKISRYILITIITLLAVLYIVSIVISTNHKTNDLGQKGGVEMSEQNKSQGQGAGNAENTTTSNQSGQNEPPKIPPMRVVNNSLDHAEVFKKTGSTSGKNK